MRFPASSAPARLVSSCIVAVSVCTACVPLSATAPAQTGPAIEATGSGGTTSLQPYLQLLAPPATTVGAEAPADAFAAARESWQDSASPRNTLRYALVLGTPGQWFSDPAGAARLLAPLLADPGELSPDEIQLAGIFLREFTARADLAEQLIKQREALEERLRASEAESHAALSTLGAETARLRREVNVLKEKLNAIAEIEQSLMEQDADPPAPAPNEP